MIRKWLRRRLLLMDVVAGLDYQRYVTVVLPNRHANGDIKWLVKRVQRTYVNQTVRWDRQDDDEHATLLVWLEERGDAS